MRRTRVVAWLCVASSTLGTSGCTPESAPLVAWSETDSSGVVLVEQRIDPDRTLELMEQLRLGAREGPVETQFFRISDGLVLPTGEVVVADAGNHRISVFTRDGLHVRSFGRQGEGPGEFQLPGGLALGDDELVVWDRTRLHFFGVDGGLRGAVDFGGAQTGQVSVPVWDGSRWLVPVMTLFDDAGELLDTRPVRVHRLTLADGLSEEGLGFTYPWGHDDTRTVGRGWIVRPVLAPDRFVRMDGLGRMLVAETGDYALDVYEPSGALVRRIRNATERRPVTREHVDEYEASQRARCEGRGGECADFLQEALPVVVSMPTPELRPVIGSLDTSSAGDILVKRQDLDPHPFEDGDRPTYDLLDPEGRHRGSFTAPAGFRPIWFDARRVLGVERDEMDVEQLVLYRFRPPSGTG